MVCFIVNKLGHNYVTCPRLTTEQIKKIKEKKQKEKQELIERRRLFQQRRRQLDEQIRLEREKKEDLKN